MIEHFSDIFNAFTDEEMVVYRNLNSKIAHQILQKQAVFSEKNSR
jgi:hypothetical protein